MNDARIVAKDIRRIFCRRIDELNQILIAEYNGIKTCDGKHSDYIEKAARDKLHWYKRVSYTNLALTMILILTAITGIWILRSFNRANKYGGCVTNFLWPFDECSTVS